MELLLLQAKGKNMRMACLLSSLLSREENARGKRQEPDTLQMERETTAHRRPSPSSQTCFTIEIREREREETTVTACQVQLISTLR